MDVFEDFDDILDNDLAEIVDFVNAERHPYTVRPRPNNFERWDEAEFVRWFRISKGSARQMLAEIEENIQHRSERNNVIPPMEQLLLALRFFASGSFYISTADFGGIHKSTSGKIISRVVSAIAERRPHHIKFPATLEERNQSSVEFFRIARFPRVVGAIDCTHIKLQSPGGDNAENFRNRKGYFSLNVQAICDSKTCFVDVVARWPRAVHDTHIFNNSAIMMFESGEMGSHLLLGDSGYPLRSYLLTPIDEPRTEAETVYNEAHIRTRNVIERTFGIWKRRFPVLSIGLLCRLQLAQKIIIAAAILHNIACQNNDDLLVEEGVDVPPNGNVLQEIAEVPVQRHENENGIRRTIVGYFETIL
ncbi:hypothetical protein RN001_003673 [Aquatica leii]|uniref:Putative nuclease HARBI1 n=1 Tax=Aquatica leii TaxID=1421715 RepID=A0AAN7SKX9_9COLE|nr:hypothetical protein RN001_003673 [Aquatica leii]